MAGSDAPGAPPLISVVVPSYNQGRWLDACLRSLFAQGDPNLEVIVMDGGSTDESPEVLRRWAPRLAHWQSRKDNGQADAIASGFERAKGAYLAWLNSDDMHMPWTLASWREAFARNPDLALVHGDRVTIDGEGRVLRERRQLGHSRWLLERWPWTHQETAVWTREVYDRVGGVDRSLAFAMDYDLFVRIFAAGRCAHVPRILGAFRWHGESKSVTQQRSTGARERKVVRERIGLPESGRERPVRRALDLAVRGLGLVRRLPLMRGRYGAPPRGEPIERAWDARRWAAALDG